MALKAAPPPWSYLNEVNKRYLLRGSSRLLESGNHLLLPLEGRPWCSKKCADPLTTSCSRGAAKRRILHEVWGWDYVFLSSASSLGPFFFLSLFFFRFQPGRLQFQFGILYDFFIFFATRFSRYDCSYLASRQLEGMSLGCLPWLVLGANCTTAFHCATALDRTRKLR